MPPQVPEFVRLLTAAGWSQAEAARRLQITPGAVSQICSGKTLPRPALLNLLKLLVAPVNPEAFKRHEKAALSRLEPWESELLAELRKLPPTQREWVATMIRQMIKGLPGVRRRNPARR